MQSTFLTYVDLVASPERKLLFQNAIDALTEAGIADHLFLIDQLMETDQYATASELLAEVDELLKGAIHSLMTRFGVGLEPSAELAISTDILRGTLALDNWSDTDMLARLCESDEEPLDIFANLLEVTTSRHADEYLPALAHVTQALINRVDELNQRYVESALPSDEERSLAQQRVEIYFEKYAAPILSEALNDMLMIGGDYHSLLAQYHDRIAVLPLETAVNELLGFAMISDLPTAEIEEAVNKETQGWWTPQTAPQVAGIVKARLKELKLP